MNQTETQSIATFDEAAESRAHLRMEEAIETFTQASRAAIDNPICPRCISPYGQWRGYRTRAKDTQTVHRRRCNTPHRGRRNKNMKTNNQESTRPEKNLRVGAVRAAVCKRTYDTRDGRQFDARRVVLDRSYKDVQGEWKNTNSYDANYIPKAMLALEQAYAYLTTKDNADSSAVSDFAIAEVGI